VFTFLFFVKMSGKVYKKGTRHCSARASRNSITKRKPPNRHSFEVDTEDVSRLAKKIKSSTEENKVEMNAEFGYRIINFFAIFNMLSQILTCKTCGGSVTFTEHVNVALDLSSLLYV